MKRYFFGSAAAVLCASALVAAQAPASPNQQVPSQPQSGAQGETRTTAQAGGGATTTVTGCIYREEDVPGRTPNVAERAGVLEDYILADVRMAAGADSPTGTSGAAGAAAAGGGAVGAGGAAGAAGAAGATGTGAGMYKLELIDDNRLQALVGKRVEVTGRIDREAGDAGGRPQGTTGAGATGAPGAVSGNPGAAGDTAARPGGVAGAAGAGGQSQAGAQADRSIGPDRIELPEFEVTSIREIAGTCAATPSGR